VENLHSQAFLIANLVPERVCNSPFLWMEQGFLSLGGRGVKQKKGVINSSSEGAVNDHMVDVVDDHGTHVVDNHDANVQIDAETSTGVMESNFPKLCELASKGNHDRVGSTDMNTYDIDYLVWLPLASIHKVNDRMKNSPYGYFIGKRLVFPIVQWFIRNNWEKYGLKKATLVKGFFSFKFSSTEGVDSVLKDGPWMIRGVPVKFHDVSLVAYTSNWSSYARILIEIDTCYGFSHNLVMTVPKLEGPGYTKETIPIKCWKRKGWINEGFIEVKKKKTGDNGGTKNFKPILVKPKTQYCPKVIQTSAEVSPKTASSVGKKNVSTCNSSKKANMTNATTSCNRICSLSNSFEALNVDDMVTVEVESDNKASTSGVQEEGNSSTPLVEMIHRFEKQLMEGKCVLMDEDGKPLEKINYSGDHGNEDEVEPVDNERTSFMASNPLGVGYGTKSLLEQWRETYGDAQQAYDYDPYDDDMSEGHEITDNIQTICNNLDIKVRGRA
ncbi:kinase-like domain-containing protein, partial [Tanacetum coccineum]